MTLKQTQSTAKKPRAVVICPGRGTYNKTELGYLKKYHTGKTELLSTIDKYRHFTQQIAVTELDAMANYSIDTHTAGHNASSLIYACAAADFADIDRSKIDIVALTGNSMGWYIALALSGALNNQNAIKLIDSMGAMMRDGVIGGQIIYPICDDNWQPNPTRLQNTLMQVDAVNQLDGCRCYVSINLGGYLVLAGNQKGLNSLEQNLPVVAQRFPMRLRNHGAFHTPMLEAISRTAMQDLPMAMFDLPKVPLIDGRGKIWQPHSTDLNLLHNYTLGHQVTQTYDFTQALSVALKEFAPDIIILLGPGETLGGAIGQVLVTHNWQGIGSKEDFVARQSSQPFLLSMGLEQQRALVAS